jgi:hypothetical protein
MHSVTTRATGSTAMEMRAPGVSVGTVGAGGGRGDVGRGWEVGAGGREWWW